MIQIRTNRSKFDKGIQRLKSILRRSSKSETDMIAREFVVQASIYPSETEANEPPAPYWVRGKGKIGSKGGIIVPSQHLGNSWQIIPGNSSSVIKNDATYLPWVHGSSKQAWFHKARGWKTIRAIFASIGIVGDEYSVVNINSSHPRHRSIKNRIISRPRS